MRSEAYRVKHESNKIGHPTTCVRHKHEFIEEKTVYTIKNYCMVSSLEEAYELITKSRNNVIVGGNLWLKMGKRNIMNAIDLSRLGLNRIEETEDGFEIGCMVTLRQLETHEGLNSAFGNLFSEAVRHIVGVQFRNCATVGGSLFPRFGFSDVLTAFLACDTKIRLYHRGLISLQDFTELPFERDILTHIYVKKDIRKVVYESFRITETDFPVLTCAVIEREGHFDAVIGARPRCACLVESELTGDRSDPAFQEHFAEDITGRLDFGSNIRGSASYRRELSKILIRRCLDKAGNREPLWGTASDRIIPEENCPDRKKEAHHAD